MFSFRGEIVSVVGLLRLWGRFDDEQDSMLEQFRWRGCSNCAVDLSARGIGLGDEVYFQC